MTADATAAASNRLGRQTGVVWALLIIAHLLGAPLACVWHCQGGAGMAGMIHGAAPMERGSPQPPGHSHHHASSGPANPPAAPPAAAAPRTGGHSVPGPGLAPPCAPLDGDDELHPTAIFPATLAPRPAFDPAPDLGRLAAWDTLARTRLRRPTIPPPRS